MRRYSPLLVGGPVQQNTLHYIHRQPVQLALLKFWMNASHWSGDFDQMKQALNLSTLAAGCSLFCGITPAGWWATG